MSDAESSDVVSAADDDDDDDDGEASQASDDRALRTLLDRYDGDSSYVIAMAPKETNTQMIRAIDVLHMDDGYGGNQRTDEECLEFVKSLSISDLNLVTEISGSLLNVAANHCRHTVVEYLLTVGSKFQQVSARSFMGRTALHDALLRRDKWFNVELHWKADSPAAEALNVMLEHPLCDTLVNAPDSANKPPFFYALRACLKAQANLLASNNQWCDAAIEIACSHERPCVALLQHPCFSSACVKIGDLDALLRRGQKCPDLFDKHYNHRICSQMLHHVRMMPSELERMPCEYHDFNKDVNNDVLQYFYGPVLRQICLHRHLPLEEAMPVIKNFVGFDLTAEKMLHDKKCLVKLVSQGDPQSAERIAHLAKSIDSKLENKLRYEAQVRAKIMEQRSKQQKRLEYRALLVQKHFGECLSTADVERLEKLRAEGVSGFQRIEWHFEMISKSISTRNQANRDY